MTMKPNTELDTMMFFDAALEGARTQLLTELGRCRQRDPHGGGSGGGAERGRRSGPAAPDGNLVRHERRSRPSSSSRAARPSCWPMWWRRSTPICSSIPFHDPVGLALYVELRYMTDASHAEGEWYE